MSLALLKRRTQNSDVSKELNLTLTHLSKFLPKELDLLPWAAQSPKVEITEPQTAHPETYASRPDSVSSRSGHLLDYHS